MNILYVTPAYKPAYKYGGPVHSVSAAAETLVAKGHNVTVFTTNGNADEDVDVPLNQPIDVEGVTVWYFQRTEPIKKVFSSIPYLAQSTGFLYAPQMKDQLIKIMPEVDIVNTQLPYNYPTYIAGRVARQFKKPLFYHQRGDFDPVRLKYRGLKKRLYIRFVEMPNLRYATGLVALTERESESYRLLGLKNPIHIIPNGIHTNKMKQVPTENFSQIFNIPSDSVVILFLGRLHVLKGANQLIEGFLKIQEKIPESVLIMAGPDQHGLQASFIDQVKQANLIDRVIFPGMVSGETKSNLLARADLFCLPSSGEGFSMAVLEALASQTAVLLSPGCYFPEVATADAGLIVDPNPDAIGEALIKMVSSPERLKQMGAKGIALVRERYTWDYVTDQLLKMYSSATKKDYTI
jgi:glycosyltransferase involved in cell wall biosynthesis